MGLFSSTASSIFDGGVRLMRDGKHVGNFKVLVAKDKDEFDITVNSTASGISVSAAVLLNELQVMALIDQLQEAVHAHRSNRHEPEGAA